MNDSFASTLNVDGAGSHMNPPPIVRPLGKLERSLWFFDQASTFNMGTAIDIHGEVTEEGLRQALRWCQARYPILRSIIRLEGKALHFAFYDLSAAPEIPLAVCSDFHDNRDQIATEEMRKPFDGFRELMIRAKFVSFGDGSSSLFVTFNHVIGDGFSAANLMVDLIKLLGLISSQNPLPELEPRPFPPAAEDGIEHKFKGFKGLLKMMGCQAQVTGKMRRLGDMPVPLRNNPDIPFSQRQVSIESFTFDAAVTAALIQCTKQEKVTLYALLIAIILDAIYPLLAESKKKKDTSDRVISMPIPVNMRSFLTIPVKNDFGFYASTIEGVVRKLQKENDILLMAREIRSEIKAAMRRESARLFVMPMISTIMSWKLFFPVTSQGIARAAKFITGMAQYSSTSLSFLNQQKVPTKAGALSFSHARGYVSPSILGTAVFCAVLFDEMLTVYLSYNEKQFSKDDAELLKRRFKSGALEVANRITAVHREDVSQGFCCKNHR